MMESESVVEKRIGIYRSDLVRSWFPVKCRAFSDREPKYATAKPGQLTSTVYMPRYDEVFSLNLL